MKSRAFFYSFKTRVTLVLVLAMVFVTGLNNFFVYRFNLASNFEQLRKSLIAIAQTASLAVDAEALQTIPLTREGVRTPAYREIASKLYRVVERNSPLQYVYIMAKTDTPGILRFIVDTDVPIREGHTVKGAARPGDLYDARRLPEMLAAFEKPSADRELSEDPWGLVLSGYAPIYAKDGKVIAIIGVDILANDIAKMQHHVKQRMAVVFFSGILLCCVLGILIAGSVSDPVRKLAEGTRQLAKDNLDYRVDVRSRDEIGELADSFNKMAESLWDSRKRLQNYFFKVAQALVRALEAKDSYTQGHSQRVADLARKVALELGVDPEKAELVWCVAELHDVGKLVVKEAILNKKGKLDPEEWAVMKEHPVTGEKILEPVLDEELLRVIRSHHERVDGGGYPDGLKGEEIDQASQIVSIADAYDAMTSIRPYRQPMTHEAALGEIKRASGTQFRPEVVKAFLRVIERLEETGEARP